MGYAFDFIGGNPGNYVLGRGKLQLKGEYPGSPLGWRDIGNCTAFTLTQESEKKEHLSYLAGIKTVDLEVPVSTKVTIAFTIDEVANLINQAMFLSGTPIGYSSGFLTNPLGFGSGAVLNAAAVASTDVSSWGVGVGPFLVGISNNFVMTAGTVLQDLWYDISMGFSAAGSWRAYNFDSTQTITVKKNCTSRDQTTGALLTEGTDYELDRVMGRIRMKVWNPADLLLVSWTAPAVARNTIGGDVAGLDTELKIVKPLTSTGLTVGLKFILENPNSNIPIEYEFFSVKLSPDGELALLGDDWGSMAFTGVVASTSNSLLGASPYGRVTSRGVIVA